METYFIRHTWKCSIDEKTRERMWNSRRVFIHFPWDSQRKQQDYNSRRTDSTSANPNDYDGSDKRAIKALRALADNGGYPNWQALATRCFPKSITSFIFSHD
jgi:hypothetical protein